MPASTRLKAQNIIFKIGTTDYSCDANMIELTLNDAPGDVQTFCEISTAKEWKLQLDGIMSQDTGSLYQLLWTNFGSQVAFTLAPSGNVTASTTQPHYTGTVKFDDIPPLSLTSNETAKFSVTLTVVNSVHDPATNKFWGVTRKTS